MTTPAESLVEKANMLARLMASAPENDVQSFDAAPDGAVVSMVETVGAMYRLLEACGAIVGGLLTKRSERNLENPLALTLGEKSAVLAFAHLADVPVSKASDWCALGKKTAARTSWFGEDLGSAYPVVTDALNSGVLALESGRMIVETLEKVGRYTRPDKLAELEITLVQRAAEMSIADLVRLCRTIPDLLNPDGDEQREEELRKNAGIMIVNRRDGMTRWTIDLDPESAGFAMAALDARTAPRRAVQFELGTDDVREMRPVELRVGLLDRERSPLAQVRLDAFISILTQSLKADLGDTGGTAVTMLVTIPLENLVNGTGGASIFGVEAPISAKTARRLACEADILPIVLGGESEPLDLGRSKRLFSKSQRLAMAIRDQGCVWTSCPEPPSHCEAAHLDAWAPGGMTDLKNGVLLCRFHHRRLDNDGWQIEFQNGIPFFIPPHTVDSTRTPRRGGRPQAA